MTPTPSKYAKPGALTHREFFELASFVKQHRVEFAGKWPQDLVTRCAEAIGKPVTADAIRRAGDCCGITFQHRERKPKPAPRAQLLHPVTRGDVILARELIRLVQSLGEKPSQELVNLASGSLL